MADNRISLPSGTAGITRFFDEYKSKIHFKPGVIIFIAILVMVVEIILYLYGYSILGVA
jgi:preprotein translocase subunit Sec61beta